MALMDIDSELGDEGISESELRQGVHGNSELANADKPDAELRDGNQTAGKLTNGNDASGRDRHTVGSVFEGNVEHRKPEKRGFGFVFKAPSIPFVFGGEWSPATGTRHGLFRDLVLAFPARLHDVGVLVVC
jgi:hypothetical protein